MEKEIERIPCICAMRDLYQALAQLEAELQETYGITLNEAMVLCSIGNGIVTAGSVSSQSGLKPSHASKIIAAVEERGLVTRSLDGKDKRLMCFALTETGKSCLTKLKKEGIKIPRKLRYFFKHESNKD